LECADSVGAFSSVYQSGDAVSALQGVCFAARTKPPHKTAELGGEAALECADSVGAFSMRVPERLLRCTHKTTAQNS
jgi:hypothetical protein